MWYKNSFRRHLCDMHIDDWNPEFLSKFSPTEYVENLKRGKIQNAMLYFQSHVGLCYYPTRIGKMHNAFIGKEDMMRELVDLCHRENISVTGYYSLIYNTYEHDRHPEWRMLDVNGNSRRMVDEGDVVSEFSSRSATSRYGFCCPNNAEYRKFCEAQIREMAEYFPNVEGMFYDMLFWPHSCYCESCRNRWRKEVGGELPAVADWSDKRWLLFNAKRREWMGEFAMWITDVTRAAFGNVSVEHNVSRSASPIKDDGNAEEVIAACDYAGGDRYVSPFGQSFACKFYRSITKNAPFEYMFSRCAPTLATHTQIKSEDTMRSALFLTTAHHGATLIIDAIDPIGTMDSRVYDRIGKIFEEVTPYEPYLRGEPVEDVGIYYSLKSKFSKDNGLFTNYTGSENSTETFAGGNVLSGVTGGFADIYKYKAILMPSTTSEDEYDNARIVDYVKRGGKLYFSGDGNEGLLKEFFGARVVGKTKEKVVYIAPEKAVAEAFDYFDRAHPIAFPSSAPIVEGIDKAFVAAKITLPYTHQDTNKFASIHSNPPGIPTDIPAMAIRAFGKGVVIWSALEIESQKLYDYRNIILGIFEKTLKLDKSLISDAPYDVELTLFADGDSLLLSSTLLTDAYKARKVESFNVSVKKDGAVGGVVRLPERAPVDFVRDGKFVKFRIEAPGMFEAYEIF